MTVKVAVLLAGCGVYDGSEIHESVLTMLALDAAGAAYECCAPEGDQMHVVDHLAGRPSEGEARSIMRESARIARGKVRPLSKVSAADYDALVIPGGFGAAKNLCTYAVDGREARANPEVARVVREFVKAGKPVGAMCIAPAAVAAVFRGDPDVRPVLTIGSDPGTAADLEAMGAAHLVCDVRDCVTDPRNRIVSTPAYMIGKGPAEVSVGIGKLVKALLDMCGGR